MASEMITAQEIGAQYAEYRSLQNTLKQLQSEEMELVKEESQITLQSIVAEGEEIARLKGRQRELARGLREVRKAADSIRTQLAELRQRKPIVIKGKM